VPVQLIGLVKFLDDPVFLKVRLSQPAVRAVTPMPVATARKFEVRIRFSM
jgi:hypothetical protein